MSVGLNTMGIYWHGRNNYIHKLFKGILFEDSNRISKNIRAEAEHRNLEKPNAEVACLIREKFTDEELKNMGLL